MNGLEPLALAALCCLGGLVALIVLPYLVPVLAQLLGFVVNLVTSCLQMLIGFPLGCGCSCLLFVLLAVVVAAVGVVLVNNACSANPAGLCSLLGY